MHYFVTDRLETEQILQLQGMLAYVHSVGTVVHATAQQEIRTRRYQALSQVDSSVVNR